MADTQAETHMKKLLLIALFFVPFVSFAASPTHSITLVKTSSQGAFITTATNLNITSTFTVETWLKWNPGGVVAQSVFGRFDNVTNGLILTVRNDTLFSGKKYTLYYTVFSGGSEFTGGVGFTTPTIDDGNWHDVAWVVSGGTLTAYVDGTSEGTAAYTAPGSNTAKTTIGYDNNAGAGYESGINGNMMMTRVWNTTRTAAQISGNWCNFLGATTNLQGEWGFDNSYADDSGNGYTLTGLNTPTFTTDIPSVCVTPVNLPGIQVIANGVKVLFNGVTAIFP